VSLGDRPSPRSDATGLTVGSHHDGHSKCPCEGESNAPVEQRATSGKSSGSAGHTTARTRSVGVCATDGGPAVRDQVACHPPFPFAHTLSRPAGSSNRRLPSRSLAVDPPPITRPPPASPGPGNGQTISLSSRVGIKCAGHQQGESTLSRENFVCAFRDMSTEWAAFYRYRGPGRMRDSSARDGRQAFRPATQ
jgi:hypothetical protein